MEYAKQILQGQAKAILSLVPLIDQNFEKAVEWIVHCQGFLVVTGMGKSGLVGKKISATFASTGTHSISLHPAEAVHGDLGRMTPRDIVLALSKGGETEEILRLIPYVKKMGIQIIGITCNANSSLAKYSDLVLCLGNIEETCPLGMAPTASTTAMLAMGDALAMCVCKKRNFTREEYALYHPGGSLGRKLMKVQEIMRTGQANPCVLESLTVTEVIAAITKARAGAASIVNTEGKLTGIFTDGDLRRYFKQGIQPSEVFIKEVMTHYPFTVSPDTLVVEAIRILKQKKIDELPVVDAQSKPIGMLDVQDILDIGFITT